MNKFKISLLFLIIFTSINLVNAEYYLVRNSPGDTGELFYWYNAAGNNEQCSSFNVTNGTYNLGIISFSIKKVGSPIFYLAAYLRNDSGFTISNIISTSLTNYSVNSDFNSTQMFYNFTFPEGISLPNNSRYWACLKSSENYNSITDYLVLRYALTGDKRAYSGASFSYDSNLEHNIIIYSTSSSTLNISNAFPMNNSILLNNTVNFNMSVNSSANVTCLLYIDNILNSTQNMTNGTSRLINYSINFNVNESYMSYFISCSNGLIQRNSSINQIYISILAPVMNSSYSGNTSYAFFFLSGTTTISDSLINSYNISIDSRLINRTVNYNFSTLNYSLRINVSNLTAGYHNLTFCASDSTYHNCVTYLFDKINITDNSDTYGYGNMQSKFNFSLYHNGTYNFNITLHYNNSLYNLTKNGRDYYGFITLPSNLNDKQDYRYYIDFYSNSSTYSYYNKTSNTTFSQYMIKVTNCSFPLYNTTVINFTFRDEVTLGYSTGKIDFYGSVYKNSLYTKNYTILFQPDSEYHLLCIYPSWENYTLDGWMDYYNSTISSKKSYFFNDVFLNSSSLLTYILSLSELNGTYSSVLISVKDNDQMPFEGVKVRLQKFNLGSWIEVDQEITDFQGQVLFHVVYETERYKLIYEYPIGTIVLEPGEFVFHTSSSSFTQQIILQETLNPQFELYAKATGTISYNNNTNTLTYIWIDTSNSISESCLYIYKTGVHLNGTIINQSCTTGYSGSISLQFTPTAGYTFEGKGIVTYPSGSDLNQTQLANYIVPVVQIVLIGGIGWFIVGIMVFVMSVGLGFNPQVGVLLSTIPLYIGLWLQLIQIDLWMVVSLTFLSIIIAFILGGRN